jgi:hypothetical protein
MLMRKMLGMRGEEEEQPASSNAVHNHRQQLGHPRIISLVLDEEQHLHSSIIAIAINIMST